jgi:hypothetical protein
MIFARLSLYTMGVKQIDSINLLPILELATYSLEILNN